MSKKEIKKEIEAIRILAEEKLNDEAAHQAEDSLRATFIDYVATLSDHFPDLAEKAQLVASTYDLRFSRWCA